MVAKEDEMSEQQQATSCSVKGKRSIVRFQIARGVYLVTACRKAR